MLVAGQICPACTLRLAPKIGNSPHVLRDMGPQTDTSAPAGGTATAKHYRDMM